jgi:hypothetical protein
MLLRAPNKKGYRRSASPLARAPRFPAGPGTQEHEVIPGIGRQSDSKYGWFERYVMTEQLPPLPSRQYPLSP